MNNPEERGANERAIRGRCALFLTGHCPAPAGCACLGIDPPRQRSASGLSWHRGGPVGQTQATT